MKARRLARISYRWGGGKEGKEKEDRGRLCVNASQRFIETKFISTRLNAYFIEPTALCSKGGATGAAGFVEINFARGENTILEREREKNYTPCKFTDLINSSLESRATRSEV